MIHNTARSWDFCRLISGPKAKGRKRERRKQKTDPTGKRAESREKREESREKSKDKREKIEEIREKREVSKKTPERDQPFTTPYRPLLEPSAGSSRDRG